MRNKQNKHLGIEIDPELHYKLHYISKYYGRSANGQILYLIRQEIKAFEKTEGEIARLESKLSNEGFVAKAPAAVVEGEKEKLAKYKEKLEGIKAAIAKLK